MKADVKSSGIAAPVAQPRHPGELAISLAPNTVEQGEPA